MNINFKTLPHDESGSIQIIKEILTHHFELQKFNGVGYHDENERQAIIQRIVSPFLCRSKADSEQVTTKIADINLEDFPTVYLPDGNSLTILKTLMHVLDTADYQKIANDQDIALSGWNDLVKYASGFGGSIPLPKDIREDNKKSYLEYRYEAIATVSSFVDEHMPEHKKDLEDTLLSFILSFAAISRDKDCMMDFLSQAEIDRMEKEEMLPLLTRFHVVGSSKEAQDKLADIIEPLLIRSNQCFSPSFAPVFNQGQTKLKNGEHKSSWKFSISNDYNVVSEFSGVRALGECIKGMKNKKLNSLLLMDSVMYALTTPHTSPRNPLDGITEALACSDINGAEDERMVSLFGFLDSLSEKVVDGLKYNSVHDYQYDEPNSPPIQINKWDPLTETIINAVRQTTKNELKNIEIRKIYKKEKLMGSTKSRKSRKVAGISL